MKIGCDIVYLPRFKKILKRTPSMRRNIFSIQEEKNAPLEKLAGIFAAKEAAAKAANIPPGHWHDIQISFNTEKKPILKFYNNGKIIKTHAVSISHDGDYVIAVVGV
jgi:holo-[acyl-carrier protein] synthase